MSFLDRPALWNGPGSTRTRLSVAAFQLGEPDSVFARNDSDPASVAEIDLETEGPSGVAIEIHLG